MTPRWVPKKVLCVEPVDQVGALGEGLLEVRPEQAEHVGHVVKDDGVDALLRRGTC